MVYYPSMPLIMKTEPATQPQFCSSLTSTNSSSSDGQLYQPTSNMVIQQSIASIAGRMGGNGVSSSPPSTSTCSDTILLGHSYQMHEGQNIAIFSANQSPSSIRKTSPSSSSSKKSSSSPGKPQFKCDQCGMTFGSKSAHTSHTKSHVKVEGSNSASIVSVTAELPAGIPKTPQIKANGNGSDPYQCNVCQKTFAVPARLIRHYRTHTGERPFECEFCHKLFSVKENLQVHRRIHTKERPYKCDVCGRAFEHSGKLHRHMRIHTGERPHKCSVCGKTFIQSGQLVIHMRTHTGEKPYKCPVEGCGKGFTCSKQLKVHSRTHTGEKPYHCDICFRDFGYNHVLKLHRVQHYGSKCYKCTICDETFKSKKEMEAHIKGHANELPDDEETPSGSKQQDTSYSSSTIMIKQRADSPNSPSPSSIILDTDQSRDSGVAISNSCNNTGSSSASLDEMPPELQAELNQNQRRKRHPKQMYTQQLPDKKLFSDNDTISFSNIYHRYQARSDTPTDEQQESLVNRMAAPTYIGRPTINPALLEAASLASRRVLFEEDSLNLNTMENFETLDSHSGGKDLHETDDIMTNTLRQTFFAPAPVPEFRSSLPDSDIVRQVEAAIAGAGLSPLRPPSNGSPERSSSPESDSMMMADRDVMTLPLRKRKLYLKDDQTAKAEVPKVMRMSSVIQFAKAS